MTALQDLQWSRLMLKVDAAARPRCDSCGRFVDCETARCHYEPLSEFGPEIIEWTCRACNPPAQAIEAGTATTGTGVVHESAVPTGMRPSAVAQNRRHPLRAGWGNLL